MPIGLALAYANVPVLSEIAQRLCRQFVPLAILPLPAAVLFQGYALLFADGPTGVVPDTPFLSYLVVVSLPFLALWVTWKTFKYATPLTARIVGGGVRGAATLGAVVGAGYVAGPYAATTAAHFGARAGLTQAATQRALGPRPTQTRVRLSVQ
jgi:type IV secretion system protein TrbL